MNGLFWEIPLKIMAICFWFGVLLISLAAFWYFICDVARLFLKAIKRKR